MCMFVFLHTFVLMYASVWDESGSGKINELRAREFSDMEEEHIGRTNSNRPTGPYEAVCDRD